MTHALLPYAEAHIDRTVTMAVWELCLRDSLRRLLGGDVDAEEVLFTYLCVDTEGKAAIRRVAAEERGKFLQQQQKENYVCDYTS